jgi:hypothetical protein
MALGVLAIGSKGMGHLDMISEQTCRLGYML